jgi:hypothetical protein
MTSPRDDDVRTSPGMTFRPHTSTHSPDSRTQNLLLPNILNNHEPRRLDKPRGRNQLHKLIVLPPRRVAPAHLEDCITPFSSISLRHPSPPHRDSKIPLLRYRRTIHYTLSTNTRDRESVRVYKTVKEICHIHLAEEYPSILAILWVHIPHFPQSMGWGITHLWISRRLRLTGSYHVTSLLQKIHI